LKIAVEASGEAAIQRSLGRSPRNTLTEDLALKARNKTSGTKVVLAAQSAIDTGINPRLQRWALILCSS